MGLHKRYSARSECKFRDEDITEVHPAGSSVR